MQAFAHHGMNSPVELLFLISVVAEPVSEMLRPADAPAVRGAAGDHYNALNRTGKARLVQPRVNFLLRGLSFVPRSRTPQVKINDDIPVRRHFLNHREQGLGCLGQAAILDARGEEMNTLP